MRVFSVYFWHSRLYKAKTGVDAAASTPKSHWTGPGEKRSSAGGSVEASQVTGHSWLVACDATVSPVVFEKSLLCQSGECSSKDLDVSSGVVCFSVFCKMR